jgi:hypothetical protein
MQMRLCRIELPCADDLTSKPVLRLPVIRPKFNGRTVVDLVQL